MFPAEESISNTRRMTHIHKENLGMSPGYPLTTTGRAWANAWDVFRRTPSRGGRGRRAAVDFVVCFGCGGILFSFSFFFLRTHTAASMRQPSLIYLSTSKGSRKTNSLQRGNLVFLVGVR